MDNNNGDVIPIAIGAVLLGFVLWGLAQVFEALGTSVLPPTFRFVEWYLAAYGKTTIEVLAGVTIGGLIALAGWLHVRVVRGLTVEFTEYWRTAKLEEKRLNEHIVHTVEMNHLRYLEKEAAEKRLLDAQKEIKALKADIDVLWIEIEKLIEPEKVAEKAKHEEQQQHQATLLEYVDQIGERSSA